MTFTGGLLSLLHAFSDRSPVYVDLSSHTKHWRSPGVFAGGGGQHYVTTAVDIVVKLAK